MELSIRNDVLEEARSWLGTPFHHHQAVKGRGVDCAMFLVSVYHAVGLVPEIVLDPYAPDWHLHCSMERFLTRVGEYAQKVDSPQSADVALYRYGRCISHGAIVENPGYIIHAYTTAGAVVRTEMSSMNNRLAGFWRLP